MISTELKQIRRVAAEVLASAMQKIFPGVTLIAGCETDLGFYYDFLLKQPLTEETLFLVEECMRGIIKEDIAIETLDMMRQNAIAMFEHQKQPYKADELKAYDENVVQIWKMGDFFDVAKPFVGATLDLAQAFKLQKVERKTISLPFYEKNGERHYQKIQVIRISGAAAENKYKLKEFLKKLKAWKGLDHRSLGEKLKLFTFEDEMHHEGVCWLPKGMFVRDQLLNFLKNEEKLLGFQSVLTPSLVKASFLKQKTTRNSFTEVEIEGEDYCLTSDKTLAHLSLYLSSPKQPLPVRYSEVCPCFFGGKERELKGLFKTRTYLSDQAHIFCDAAEVEGELISCLQLIDKTVRMLGLKYKYLLKRRQVKSERSQLRSITSRQWLENALNTLDFEFALDKEMDKLYAVHDKALKDHVYEIEVEVYDELERRWTVSSLGINLRMDLDPTVMIYRSVFKSLEQFIALLIESSSGVLPSWLLEP